MERDLLEQLLRRADRQAGKPPAAPGDLAGRVRRSHRKRQKVARMALACSLGLVVMSLTMHRLWPAAGDVSHASLAENTSSTDHRLDELMAQADQLRLELASLKTENQNHTIAAGQPIPEPALRETQDQKLERAASLIVYQGDRYYRELGMYGQAEASYRQILNHFPNTYAAQSAQARLIELQNEKGNRS